jgi:hypothetical protein
MKEETEMRFGDIKDAIEEGLNGDALAVWAGSCWRDKNELAIGVQRGEWSIARAIEMIDEIACENAAEVEKEV